MASLKVGIERNQKQETGSFQELPELVPAALFTKVQLVLFLNSLFLSKSRSLNHENLLSFQDILYYLKYEYRKKESITPGGVEEAGVRLFKDELRETLLKKDANRLSDLEES